MIESETRQANWRRASLQKYDAQHLAVHNAVKAIWRNKRARLAASLASRHITMNMINRC